MLNARPASLVAAYSSGGSTLRSVADSVAETRPRNRTACQGVQFPAP